MKKSLKIVAVGAALAMAAPALLAGSEAEARPRQGVTKRFKRMAVKSAIARKLKLAKKRFILRALANGRAPIAHLRGRLKAKRCGTWSKKSGAKKFGKFRRAGFKAQILRKMLKKHRAARLQNLRRKFKQRIRHGRRS